MQPEGAHYPHPVLQAPPDFQTLRALIRIQEWVLMAQVRYKTCLLTVRAVLDPASEKILLFYEVKFELTPQFSMDLAF